MLRLSMGFEGMFVVDTQGHSGGLAMLWKYNEEVQLLSYSKNHIDITISPKDRPSHRITRIYGEPNRAMCDATFRILLHLVKSSNLP